MNNHRHLAAVLSVALILRVDDEVLARGLGIIAARDVLQAPRLADHHTTALLGKLSSGVGLDLFQHRFIHGLPIQ